MSLYLAVDAGGTKTDYLLADEHRELARTRSATIKLMRTGAAAATAELEVALTELATQSGRSLDTVTTTCIGTAGETVPLVTTYLREAFGQRVGGSLLLLGDVEIALDAAFPGGSGVLVLAGTGSNVAGRTHAGRLTTAGGWGPTLSDQGSGHRIGLNALRRIFLTLDEGRSTSLLEAILDFWQLRDGDDAPLDKLIAFANLIPSPDFSKLVPLVLAQALDGDPVASSVLAEEGRELAYLVRLVLRRLLAAAPGRSEPAAVAFAGSIMERVQPVRDALIADLEAEFPNIQTLPGVVDPIQGALWRARHAETTTASAP